MMEDNTQITGEDASAVYDLAILLAGIYHVTEWVRSTILLTTICIGVNLMPLWYATSIVGFYGLGAFLYIHYVYFLTDEGSACAEA
jgi:hypothetical protein